MITLYTFWVEMPGIKVDAEGARARRTCGAGTAIVYYGDGDSRGACADEASRGSCRRDL